MAILDWSQCPAVESIPGKRGGAWVFKGTRMPVSTVFENLQELLAAAEAEGFEVIVTTDRNIHYQQNLAGRKIAIVVSGKGRWTLIKPHVAQVVAAINAAAPGSYAEIEIPFT